MWLVTQHGFFNIVHSVGDVDNILTIKARRKEDLDAFQKLAGELVHTDISDINDYRYRIKLPRDAVLQAIGLMTDAIDYPKFKSRIHETQPDRHEIYFRVWDELTRLQTSLGDED